MSPDSPPQGHEPAAPPPVPGKGLGALPLLLSSPSEAFRRLAIDPQWLGNFVFVVVILIVASWLRLPQDLDFAYQMTRAGLERFDVPEADQEEILATIPDYETIGTGKLVGQIAQGVGSVVLVTFLGALIFHGLARVAGPDPTWRESSAVFWTAQSVKAVGALVLSLIVRASDSIAVSLGPGALLPGIEYGSFLGIFLDMFDIFSLASLFVLVTGVRVLLKTSPGTAWGVGGGFWLIVSLFTFAVRLGSAWLAGTL